MFKDPKPLIVLAEPHPDLVVQWHRNLASVGDVHSFTALGAAYQQGFLGGRARGINLYVLNMTVQNDFDGMEFVDRLMTKPLSVVPCVLYGHSDLPPRFYGAVNTGLIKFRRKREYCAYPDRLLSDVRKMLSLTV